MRQQNLTFWMVVATENGAQTPYNFRTQEKAQQFMQSLTGIDGVQLLKMQRRTNNPVEYHNQVVNNISGPPAKGKRVQPNLLHHGNEDWNAEKINVLGMEWAGHGSCNDVHRYEFIGHTDALIVLGCVDPHMLDVGRSRKKFGPGYETQALRFRG